MIQSNAAGKGKKKWSKGKTKEKTNYAVIIDKPTMDKLLKEVPTYKLITVAVLMDRMKITGSAARRVLADLEAQGLVKRVHSSASLKIYTRATAQADAAAVEASA